jgi:hypothetical protein
MPLRDHVRLPQNQVRREKFLECIDGRVVHRANLLLESHRCN